MLDRTSLPQIPADEQENFALFLRDHNVRTKSMFVNPRELHPIQKAVNKDKVRKMMKDKNIASVPVIVDEAGTILDGTHRWVTLVALKDTRIEVLKCLTNIDELIRLGHEFDGSFIGKSTHQEEK